MNGIIVIFLVAIAAGVFGMVALYNATVNLTHNVADAKAQLDAIGAMTTSLNNQALAATSGGDLTALAAKDGLVADQKPQYFPVHQSWPIASHY